jgi:hypothetical protein
MDDVFDVVTMLHEVRGASITLDQRIVCGEEVLIEARVQVAFVSGGRARRIPEALRSAMQADQKPASLRLYVLSTTRLAQCKYSSHELVQAWRRARGAAWLPPRQSQGSADACRA